MNSCMVDVCFLPLDISGSVTSKPGVGSFGLFHVSLLRSPILEFGQRSEAQGGTIGVSPDPCGSLPPQEIPDTIFGASVSPH